MKIYNVTLTDTYGGVPNYSWVQRGEIQVKDEITSKGLSIHGRAAVGMTGIRSSCFVDHGDMIQIDFSPLNLVLFITPKTTTEAKS